MKILSLLLLSALTLTAQAANKVDISVKFKTVDKNERKFDGPGGGDRSVETREKEMVITLVAQNPTIVGPVTVNYWAVKASLKGRLIVAAEGTGEGTLVLKKPVVITSKPFTMKEKDGDGARGRMEIHKEAEIEEYVVKVVDAKGVEIASKSSSKNAEDALAEAKPKRRK